MKFSKKLILFPIIACSYTFAANDIGEVNPYDCTVEELQIYLLKKTESTRIDSSIATWEDYKKNVIPVTTAASGGHPANSAENAAVGGVTEEETCPMFFTDAQLSDINIDTSSLSIDSLIGLLNGNVSSLADSAKDSLSSLAEGLVSELEKGICERLSTEYISNLAEDALNGAVESGTGGFGLGDITNENFASNLIENSLNQALDGSLGLYNIFDENFAQRAENALNRESNRQLDELEKAITN